MSFQKKRTRVEASAQSHGFKYYIYHLFNLANQDMTLNKHLIVSFVIGISLLSCKDKPKEVETTLDVRQKVEMTTNYGTMVLELYNETPLHRDNFIKLVKEKAYDSLLFHRVIQGFVIQGGDPESRHAEQGAMLGEGDLDYTVKAEFHPNLFHQKGALAAAREDNQDRGSSAIQFYIVQGKVYNDSLLDIAEERINSRLARHYMINDAAYTHLWDSLQKAAKDENEERTSFYINRIDTVAKTYTNFEKYIMPEAHRKVYQTQGGIPHLDENYTVFGQVVSGINVVDSIAVTKTNEQDRPIEDVRILSVRLLN